MCKIAILCMNLTFQILQQLAMPNELCLWNLVSIMVWGIWAKQCCSCRWLKSRGVCASFVVFWKSRNGRRLDLKPLLKTAFLTHGPAYFLGLRNISLAWIKAPSLSMCSVIMVTITSRVVLSTCSEGWPKMRIWSAYTENCFLYVIL